MVALSSVGRSAGFFSFIGDITFSVLRAGLILGLIYVFAQRLVPVILGKVATISRELLNLMTILFIFLFVAIFTVLGLSPALAAFVAGILIGGTLEHYQIFSQMRPLRDIFTILFFVFLGASLNLSQMLPILPKALLFVALIMLVKFMIIGGLFLYFRFHSKTAFMIGVLLAQVGEFAFVVLHQAQSEGLVSEQTYLFGITSALLTIAISPILMERRDVLYIAFRKVIKKHLPSWDTYVSYRIDREPAHIDALNLEDHVIMCGYGRVGSYIGRALTMAQIPFIAIDYNYHRVEEYRKKGINIIYGDPTDIDILDFAQAEYATALISAVPDAFSQEMIILNAKTLNPKITIFTRVALEDHQKRMKDLGAEVVVQPEFEAALSIVRKILHGYNVPKKDIVGKVQRLKLEHGMA
jgi:CPA2 family monovalent cation:H+ antiporter-2